MTLTAADHAFTLWLATRSIAKVKAELHVRFTPIERKILAYHRKPTPKEPKPKVIPKQTFTRAQIEIALAVMAAQKTEQNRNS